MANAYNSEVAQANKSSGKGASPGKLGSAAMPSLNMKPSPFPGIPGKASHGFSPGSARKAKIYTKSEGV